MPFYIGFKTALTPFYSAFKKRNPMKKPDNNDELTILFPTQSVEINGEMVEVKEYTLGEQLKYHAKFQPFITALRESLSREQAEFNLDALMSCLSAHYDNVLELVALSIHKPVDYVKDIQGEAADNLLLAWWAVNSDFFTRKAVMPLLETLAKQRLAGATS